MGDIERLGRLFGIPLGQVAPSVFPTNTIKAQRVLAALHLSNRLEEMELLAMALFRAYWGGGGVDIGSDAGLGQVLSATLGAEAGARLLEQAQSAETKKQLEQNTARASQKGCFGAPWFEVQRAGAAEVCLWGSDRVELLCHELGRPYLGPNPAAAKL